MLIENSFTVPADPERVWNILLDVERIAPCMPGAEITEQVDERHWKGKVNVKFGPVSLAFNGTVEMTERDDQAHRVVLSARGMEQKGKGAATASVTSWLQDEGGSTTVKMEADITLTGPVAQLSRGLLPEVSKKLTAEFANCLAETMSADGGGPETSVTADGGGPETSVTDGGGGAATSATDGGGGAATIAAADGPGEAAAGAADAAPPPRPVAKPVSGLSVGLSAIWSLIVGFFQRLFGRRPAE